MGSGHLDSANVQMMDVYLSCLNIEGLGHRPVFLDFAPFEPEEMTSPCDRPMSGFGPRRWLRRSLTAAQDTCRALCCRGSLKLLSQELPIVCTSRGSRIHSSYVCLNEARQVSLGAF